MTDLIERAKLLKEFFDQGLINEEKYDRKMDEILAEQTAANKKKHLRDEGKERSEADKAELPSPSKKKGAAQMDPTVVVRQMELDDDDDGEDGEEEEEAEEEEEEEEDERLREEV